jgi:hypothetical protein
MMAEFMEIAEEVMLRACGGDQEKFVKMEPLFSFDNWAGHNTAAELGIMEGGNRVPLPPGSPDMHKVIEHIFNRLANAFGRELWLYAREDDVEVYCDVVQKILFSMDVRSIRKDIRSLQDTYQSIIQSGGAWAPPGLN